jgi:hypothetical protein
LSNEPSSKPDIGIKKSSIENASIEQPEKSSQGESITVGPYQSVRQERRKNHQLISTATYYQAERRGLAGFGYGETQDGLEADTEIDVAPYSDTDF